MEINEKLDIFYRATIQAAGEQSEELIAQQEQIYRDNLAAYEQKKADEQQTRVRIAEEKVRKEFNRAASERMMELKRSYHEKQEEKKAELFRLVEQQLAEFRQTKEYERLLEKKMKEAMELADGTSLTVFLDPEDVALKERLERETGCALSISEQPFGGGIQAVIPAKNVLLDESFSEKLAREREVFTF